MKLLPIEKCNAVAAVALDFDIFTETYFAPTLKGT